MSQSKRFKSNERGATLVEFSIAALAFLTVMFGVIEFGRALWVHNALADAARRGARYAVTHPEDPDKVKNIVVYGDEDGGDTPLVPNLNTGNVLVDYSQFNVNRGTVSITIDKYEFQFVIPIVGTKITLPKYTTTLTGESVGLIPKDI